MEQVVLSIDQNITLPPSPTQSEMAAETERLCKQEHDKIFRKMEEIEIARHVWRLNA